MIDRDALREWYSQIGRKGGSAKSDEKTRAARRNGRGGGRPTRRARDLRELLKDANVARWFVEHGLASADLSEGQSRGSARRDLAAAVWQGASPTKCWTVGWDGVDYPKEPAASALWDVLESSVPARYSVTAEGSAGILRRAKRKGHRLPDLLERSLNHVAGSGRTRSSAGAAGSALGGGRGLTSNSGDVAYCLSAGGTKRINPTAETFVTDRNLRTRRLTPLEWERLQGFPDNFTRIPWCGRPEAECPDTPRYVAIGNSMAVPVMRFIGERIHATHAREERSRIMSGIRSVSKLELRAKRAAEAAAGCRLRHGDKANAGDLPGTPDYFNRKKRVAVFVNSCFFHGCPRHFRMPKTNREFWERKVRLNRERDRDVLRKFARMGWRTVTLWEHALR